MERAMFSDMLAERRRQLGYSIREASRVLRLREDIIIAFEEGDFERMPKSGYAQGMLSSYARYLGLDANMVVEAYVEDFERYKREGRRRGVNRAAMTRNGVDATSHVQPYVPSRGLLPTSGGPAGDMGSFATTRVRTRGSSISDEAMEFSADYTQVRPYTELTPPKNNTRRVRSDDSRMERSGSVSRSRGTRSRRGSSRIDADSARGGTGSMSRRGSGSNASGRQTRGRRGRGGSRQPNRPSLTAGIPPVVFVVVGGLLVIGLALLLVLGVGSCVHREPTSSHTIPVTAADDTTSDQTQGNASTSTVPTSIDVTELDSDKSGTSSSTTEEKETSVSVSVAADAVTWLEIDCDGVSEVAETVTGPWQHTYTVEESISIQAGDTTAVSVVRDGSQVQFESMASGIGTIRIQGTPSSKSKSKSKSDTSASDSTSGKQGTSTKSNGASADSDEEEEELDGSSSDDGSYEDDYAYDYEDDSSYEDDSYNEDDYEDEQY